MNGIGASEGLGGGMPAKPVGHSVHAPGATAHWERWALAALVCVHLVLGVYYSIVVPIGEAHDEDGHYYFVRHLAVNHRLPRPGERSSSPNDEMHQPPLYYLLASLPVSLVRVDRELALKSNPYFPWADAQGGYNRFVHNPPQEAWPYRGAVLAFHVARWVSVLLGALGILFTFLAGRALSPGDPWVRWMGALVLAFWPQYRFTTAVINNDILVTVCGAAVTWAIVCVAVSPEPRGRYLVALGLGAGASALAKNNGLWLVPAVVAALGKWLAASWRSTRRRTLGAAVAALVPGVALAASWYAFNMSHGAGAFGKERSLAWLGGLLSFVARGGLWKSKVLLPALKQGLFSFWAALGWNNVGLPLLSYHGASIWFLLSLLGLLVWALRKPPPPQARAVAICGLVPLCVIGGGLVLYAGYGQEDLQGRYLLPALPALSLLLATGWLALVPRAGRVLGAGLVAGVLTLQAALIPSISIKPAYAPPSVLDEEDLAQYTPVRARFGDLAELVGYRIETPAVGAGDRLQVKLAWRTLARSTDDYVLEVNFVEPEYQFTLARVLRLPGRGTLATSEWPVGQVFEEEVAARVTNRKPEGRLAWVEVRLCNQTSGQCVPVFDGSNAYLGDTVRFGRIKVRGTEQGGLVAGGGIQFGNAIRLVAVQPELELGGERRLNLALNWMAASQPAADYTVSLQLRRPGSTAIATQVDSQPRGGLYPTSLWEASEKVRDLYSLVLPQDLAPGTYVLYACMYDAGKLQRLTVLNPQGQALPNAESPLLLLEVDGDGQVTVSSMAPGAN